MIFFTRELYLGYQPNSGRVRQAERTWECNREIYQAYRHIIMPIVQSFSPSSDSPHIYWLAKAGADSQVDQTVVALRRSSPFTANSVQSSGVVYGLGVRNRGG